MHWLGTYDAQAKKRLTRSAPFEAPPKQGRARLMRRSTALLVVYIVIGVVVAYSEDYLENLDRVRRLISAILAIVLWPLVLLGFDVRVT